jgi:hypothetical protein
MIQKNGDYYIYEENSSQDKINLSTQRGVTTS